VVEQWVSTGGHYPAAAYRTAFALNLALQIAALACFAGGAVWARMPRSPVVLVRIAREYIADIHGHFIRLCRIGARNGQFAWKIFRQSLVDGATRAQSSFPTVARHRLSASPKRTDTSPHCAACAVARAPRDET
jgi:hypothetical protein